MLNKNQLQLKNISIRRGEKLLINHLDSQWNSGDFIQIEGHNGIGKTSLLRILAGLAQPETGDVLWNQEKISICRENYHNQLLYLGHQAGIKPELSAWENLKFYQQTTPCDQSEEALWNVLEIVGLLGREDLNAGQLSAGQQKRIALARLWLSTAPLWILDEPFTAIDQKGVENLTALFEEHASKGGIVILTSHQKIPSDKLEQVRLDNYKNIDGDI